MHSKILFATILWISLNTFPQSVPSSKSLELPRSSYQDRSRASIFETSGSSPNVHLNELSVSVAAQEKRAFELVNQIRRQHGLRQLEWSEDVARVARSHSRHMAELRFFNHRDTEGLMVNDRADKFGIHDWRSIGENIAFNRGYGDPVEVAIENWMDSRAHRENLLKPEWNESAVGIAVSPEGSYYFTQVFLIRR